MKHILSFDIAKGKSVYCFIDELRNTIIDATLIEHNKNEFDKLYNLIKDYSTRAIASLEFIEDNQYKAKLVEMAENLYKAE